VVVDAGPLDLRAIPLRRGVVEGEDDPIPRIDPIEDDPQQDGGDLLRLAADRVEEVVVGPEVDPEPDRSPPTRCDPTPRYCRG
jgi:hypothetical protein